jgi:uncharacterized protein (TIGR03084 family)
VALRDHTVPVPPADPPASPRVESLESICDDLDAEHASLDIVVASLDDETWGLPTPATGWLVRDQIGHLAYFDHKAARAAADPDGFVAWRDEALADLSSFRVESEALGRQRRGRVLLEEWRAARLAMMEALRSVDPSTRLPWFGPPMSPRSFVSARLMETWAHGQDVRDAVGAPPEATDRLRHVAHLGVATRAWSYVVRGREAPRTDVRVELDPPGGGGAWTWGDAGAADRVTGPALDFCLVVTQRRHGSETRLHAKGAAAEEWLSIAQAFAGPPTIRGRPGA